jgi:hypothetical protein
MIIREILKKKVVEWIEVHAKMCFHEHGAELSEYKTRNSFTS